MNTEQRVLTVLRTVSVGVVTGHRWRSRRGSFEECLVKGLFVEWWVGVGVPRWIMCHPGAVIGGYDPSTRGRVDAITLTWR